MNQASEKLANFATIGLLAGAVVLSAMSWSGGRHTINPGDSAAKLGATAKDWRRYASSGHRIGATTAPVVITEFSDFLCPFCAKSQATLRGIEAKYGGQVAIAFHHWPQPSLHPRALEAAIASECAADQGAFERYHNLLFAVQESIDSVSWTDLAHQAGVPDTNEFQRCATERRHADAIAIDARAAEGLGARGTPFFLVNERVIPGALPPAVFDSVVQTVLTGLRHGN
jgi:protein-disulfide isomerase